MLFWKFDIQSVLAGFVLGYIIVGLMVLCIMMYTGDFTKNMDEESEGEKHATDKR